MAKKARPQPRAKFVHTLLRARDYQDRPERERLCDWWRDSAAGVCALVGIGGAGKTAVVDQFLRALPDVMPEQEDRAKDDSLPAPEGLFVSSFYDAPNPGVFFAQVCAWLKGKPYEPSAPRPSYHQTLELIEGAEGLLLVLDGLEKVQDDGARGGAFGRVVDGALRDFLLRLADGVLPGVAALVTTRFPLDDLEYEQSLYYEPIPVERIAPEACIALIRRRGVQGTDEQLRRLAEQCGRHALTVDLAAGYIAHFRGGDPTTPLDVPDPEQLRRAAAKTFDRRLRYVAEQGARFFRIAERYRASLAQAHPEALALLERVCLFRLGVDAELLAEIFTGPGKEAISGPDLARLDADRLRGTLHLLTELRLLESTDDGRYSIHPAVRDGFLGGLDTDTIRKGHEAVNHGLRVELGKVPGSEFTMDPARLDLYEEIIYHCLQGGHAREAYEIFTDRMNGIFVALLGGHERIERICRGFPSDRPPLEAGPPQDIDHEQLEGLLISWSVSLKNLGRLDAASACLERAITSARAHNSKSNISANVYEQEISMLSGQLAECARRASEIDGLLTEETKKEDDVLLIMCKFYTVFHLAMRGLTDSAVKAFGIITEPWMRLDPEDQGAYAALRGDWHASFLVRVGDARRARDFIALAIEGFETIDEFGSVEIPPNMMMARAEADLADGCIDEALNSIRTGHDWALARDAKELLCWSGLLQGRAALAEVTLPGKQRSEEEVRRLMDDAIRELDEGLRIARECGYGLYHIDLLAARARVHLVRGDDEAAERDARVALVEGVHPPAGSGLPVLLAATDPECGYAWGEGDARQALGEALLLHSARALGRPDFDPAQTADLPEKVRGLIGAARAELEHCQELRRRIRDPKQAETDRVIAALEGGRLTDFPLKRIDAKGRASGEADVENAARDKIFISYSHKDQAWLKRLQGMLTPLLRGEDPINLWSDTQIKAGARWRQEIGTALDTAKVAVLLVSPNFLASDFIAKHELTPILEAAKRGELKLIWVAVSSSLYKATELKDFQAANDPARPLAKLDAADRDAELVQICEQIEAAYRS
jgi:hypothetical protein